MVQDRDILLEKVARYYEKSGGIRFPAIPDLIGIEKVVRGRLVTDTAFEVFVAVLEDAGHAVPPTLATVIDFYGLAISDLLVLSDFCPCQVLTGRRLADGLRDVACRQPA